MNPPTQPKPKLCQGWVIRSNVIEICGEPFTRKSRNATGHTQCVQRRVRLRSCGLILGDVAKPPKPCQGWVIRRGLIEVCGELFPWKSRKRIGHAQCIGRRWHLRSRGFALGDLARPPRQKQNCIGWMEGLGMIVKCDHSFTPRWGSPKKKYHSMKCKRQTAYLRKRGFKLGDAYVKFGTRTSQTSNLCKDWIISRDGHIVECGQSFRPRKATDRYCPEHTRRQGHNSRYWSSIGYHLGDSVRRKCAYRKCEEKIDRIQRSKDGNYYCCLLHCRTECNLRAGETIRRLLAAGKRKPVGRPETRVELFRRAEALHRTGRNWPQCADTLIPDEAKENRHAAAERLRVGVAGFKSKEKRPVENSPNFLRP